MRWESFINGNRGEDTYYFNPIDATSTLTTIGYGDITPFVVLYLIDLQSERANLHTRILIIILCLRCWGHGVLAIILKKMQLIGLGSFLMLT